VPREPAPKTTMRGAFSGGVGAGREERRGRRMRPAGFGCELVVSGVAWSGVGFGFELVRRGILEGD
jgi:hypothetical protein